MFCKSTEPKQKSSVAQRAISGVADVIQLFVQIMMKISVALVAVDDVAVGNGGGRVSLQCSGERLNMVGEKLFVGSDDAEKSISRERFDNITDQSAMRGRLWGLPQ